VGRVVVVVFRRQCSAPHPPRERKLVLRRIQPQQGALLCTMHRCWNVSHDHNTVELVVSQPRILPQMFLRCLQAFSSRTSVVVHGGAAAVRGEWFSPAPFQSHQVTPVQERGGWWWMVAARCSWKSVGWTHPWIGAPVLTERVVRPACRPKGLFFYRKESVGKELVCVEERGRG
jgi:hypothetical protein